MGALAALQEGEPRVNPGGYPVTQSKVKNKSVAELIGDGVGVRRLMFRFRSSVIIHALTLTEGNISRAAVMLKTQIDFPASSEMSGCEHSMGVDTG
jgi:hypothetical protein